MPRSGVPAKTGRPAAPAARYPSTVAQATRGPVASAIAMIAMVCRVIGTGQKGTVIFALAVRTATPARTIRLYFIPDDMRVSAGLETALLMVISSSSGLDSKL